MIEDAEKLKRAIDVEVKHRYIDIDLLIFSKIALEIPLSTEDILINSKAFGFTHQQFIKNHSEIFRDELTKIVETKYPGGIDLTCLRDADFSDYYQPISVYANPDLCTKVKILFPKFTMFDPFTVRILDLLETAYHSASKRKNEKSKTLSSKKNST